MKNLAIIPARGSSKRIPKKNIKEFLGKPIIAYSIEAAIESELFDEIMVSTDDEEIAEIAKRYGAKVPFFRSKEAANDTATTTEALIEVLNQYKEREIEFENACCIYPTAPFVTNELLNNSFNIFEKGFDTLFPIVRYSYPIQRSLSVKDKKVSMVWPEYLNSRSQDLDLRFHDAGQFYWFRINTFLEKRKLFTSNSGYLEINELLVQDIDNETDWKIAELKFKLLND